jgi:hypothetical protein
LISRRRWLRLTLSTLAICPGLAAAAGAVPAQAAAPPNCNPDFTVDSLNGGYFTPMALRGVGCLTLIRVERGYQSCRLKHGLRGTCRAQVLGFRCRDHRDPKQAGPANFLGVATCTRGQSRVVFSYQQNLQRD